MHSCSVKTGLGGGGGGLLLLLVCFNVASFQEVNTHISRQFTCVFLLPSQAVNLGRTPSWFHSGAVKSPPPGSLSHSGAGTPFLFGFPTC